ncbi:MAG: HAD-IA family hydrolase [Acidimicrobiales bacterium]|nr:HAD-IA family hydrolase [Acidimicrobiales bacterium]
MFATVECEAAIFGCRTIRPDVSPDLPCVLAMAGADHVLDGIPPDRWALLSATGTGVVADHFTAANLPAPKIVIPVDGDATAAHYLRAAEAIGTDPDVCLSFEDTPAGVDAARQAGLQVVGVTAHGEPSALDNADLVVPSLLSVRVLGTHPFVVFEVDAIPDYGTGAARRR